MKIQRFRAQRGPNGESADAQAVIPDANPIERRKV
jgi:hypothetical protein